jgi:hypothetical protein
MTASSPFDHRPDPEIGAALRQLLTTTDDAAFAARVEAAAAPLFRRGTPGWWEVLGAWARPGVAAALAVTATATLWLAVASLRSDRDVTIEDALRRAGEGLAPAVVVAGVPEEDIDRLMWDVPDPE